MDRGVIKVADTNGVYVIKMSGDVRLTLSLSFDDFINEMFANANYYSVIFDLSEAEAVDSTTLGLMAKISLLGRAKDYMDPIIIATSRGMQRLLLSMGFDEIFQIVESADTAPGEYRELNSDDNQISEDAVREKVLEAHKTLIDLNENNHETFKELIQSLENYDLK
ncbi:MAG: anti-anti-sigma factor [Flavobacteriales bacterium]|jgi:anti-anti-sigma factor